MPLDSFGNNPETNKTDKQDFSEINIDKILEEKTEKFEKIKNTLCNTFYEYMRCRNVVRMNYFENQYDALYK